MSDRPKALVTAAVNGPGLDLLGQLADLVLDSWLDQPSLRIYNSVQLAERVAAEGANIVVVESDVCGAELYEQPIIAVASCRPRQPPVRNACRAQSEHEMDLTSRSDRHGLNPRVVKRIVKIQTRFLPVG